MPKVLPKKMRSAEGHNIRGYRRRLPKSARVVQATTSLPNLTDTTQKREVGWVSPTPTPGFIIILVVGNELPGVDLKAGCKPHAPKTKN